MSAIQLPTDPPSRNREYLTSQQWLSVFDRLPEERPRLAATGVRLDFSNVQWVGHLPLLALSLVAQTIEARHGQGAIALMPEAESVRACLDRWGFYGGSGRSRDYWRMLHHERERSKNSREDM